MLPLWFIITLQFFLGLGLGSFMNVVVLRLYHHQSLGGRSACPNCDHQLAWFDLLPVVSFLWLRGHCRYCYKSIDAQYPLVELAVALTFVVFGLWFNGDTTRLLIYNVYIFFLLAIFIFDLRYMLIPDVLSLSGIVVGAIGSIVLGQTWWQLLIAMALGGGLFLVQYLVSRGRWIGSGDIRLGVMLGAMMGWPIIGVTLFLAYCLGASIAVGLILVKRKQLTDALPFGVFLNSAALVSLLIGADLLQWYVSKIF